MKTTLPTIIVEEIPQPTHSMGALQQAERLSADLCQMYEGAINAGCTELYCLSIENRLIAAMHLVAAVKEMTIAHCEELASLAIDRHGARGKVWSESKGWIEKPH